MEKYARPDADHKRRVEQRKLLRQQQSWQQGNQNNSRQNNQYVFPMEPSQDPKPQTTPDPYITHSSTSKRAHRQQLPKFLLARQAQPRPRPRERQGSWTLGRTQETLLSLDGVDSRHTTNQCPEKKKM